MKEQRPLGFIDDEDHPMVRRTDPTESNLAWQKNKPHLRVSQRRVLEAFYALGPSIGTEIAQYLGKRRDAISPRLTELRNKNWIVKTGKRREGQAEHTTAKPLSALVGEDHPMVPLSELIDELTE